jgi:hypothetical protein
VAGQRLAAIDQHPQGLSVPIGFALRRCRP